jgi:hypothetical protein
MNCCDEYGNCNQGRDCPVRVARIVKYDDDIDNKSTFGFVMAVIEVVCVTLILLGLTVLWTMV